MGFAAFCVSSRGLCGVCECVESALGFVRAWIRVILSISSNAPCFKDFLNLKSAGRNLVIVSSPTIRPCEAFLKLG